MRRVSIQNVYKYRDMIIDVSVLVIHENIFMLISIKDRVENVLDTSIQVNGWG